jgi:hypothetical protein
MSARYARAPYDLRGTINQQSTVAIQQRITNHRSHNQHGSPVRAIDAGEADGIDADPAAWFLADFNV